MIPGCWQEVRDAVLDARGYIMFLEDSFCSIIRLPGTLVSKALCFTRDAFLSFFISFAGLPPSSLGDRRETLPRDRIAGAPCNASPKIRGALPPKKLVAKNMQNSARFQTTSNFDREYLRKGSRNQKSENVLITSDSSRVQRRKSGELWSTNYSM